MLPPPDPLAIHHPPFSAQEYPDPQVPKSRPGMGEISNPQAQHRLISRPAAPISGGPTVLRQATACMQLI